MRLGIVIGRFQPVHRQHMEQLIAPALEECDKVLFILGSSLKARDTKNPFLWQDRELMIENAIMEHYGLDHWRSHKIEFECIPVKDYPYSNVRWQLAVQQAVNHEIEDRGWEPEEIVLYGTKKDNSSYYLDLFPHWKSAVKPVVKNELGSTLIRDAWLRGDLDSVAAHLSESTYRYLKKVSTTNEGDYLLTAYEFEKDYKSQFKGSPYPVIHHTVDNIVLWRGSVLLVKRRFHPGKGLWALPGGFIKPDERLVDAAYREMAEETHISLLTNDRSRTLTMDHSWIKASHGFDDPERSRRGRTITQAFLWVVPDWFEINTRHDDDAAATKFFPLNEVLEDMNYDLFEDHQAIIAHLVLSLR
jgi:bifunctional NMN adenylyltransferase/nudix hydrolase